MIVHQLEIIFKKIIITSEIWKTVNCVSLILTQACQGFVQIEVNMQVKVVLSINQRKKSRFGETFEVWTFDMYVWHVKEDQISEKLLTLRLSTRP